MSNKEKSSGLGVYNVYGPRSTDEGRSGKINTAGVVKELQVDVRGGTFSFVEGSLPKGANVIGAYAKVSEAFDFGAATALSLGTKGSEATNGVSITAAQGEAVGVYELTPAGTWNAILAADTAYGMAATGAGITSAGNLSIVVRYVLV